MGHMFDVHRVMPLLNTGQMDLLHEDSITNRKSPMFGKSHFEAWVCVHLPMPPCAAIPMSDALGFEDIV